MKHPWTEIPYMTAPSIPRDGDPDEPLTPIYGTWRINNEFAQWLDGLEPTEFHYSVAIAFEPLLFDDDTERAREHLSWMLRDLVMKVTREAYDRGFQLARVERSIEVGGWEAIIRVRGIAAVEQPTIPVTKTDDPRSPANPRHVRLIQNLVNEVWPPQENADGSQ